MTFARILFNGREVGKVATEAELVAFLERVKAGFQVPNPIFEVEHQNGNKLYLGISPAGNHVAYVDSSLEPPYYSSASKRLATGTDEMVEFHMSEEGHVTEIPKANTLPFEDLVRVASEFLSTGVRPENAIAWQED